MKELGKNTNERRRKELVGIRISELDAIGTITYSYFSLQIRKWMSKISRWLSQDFSNSREYNGYLNLRGLIPNFSRAFLPIANTEKTVGSHSGQINVRIQKILLCSKLWWSTTYPLSNSETSNRTGEF